MKGTDIMVKCGVCFRNCEIEEGRTGFCGARVCCGGSVVSANYGKVTALALDPIEKKPLNNFCSGSMVLSLGSFGCNLNCPFCQNYGISWSEDALRLVNTAEYLSPETVAEIALSCCSKGNIGVAFTYNEPLIGFEYVRDTARLIRKIGMKNVLVTNGCVEEWVFDEISPYIDAMNIDLKGFTDKYYTNVLKGSLKQVKTFIEKAVEICHVELTVLIVPKENDTEEEMRLMCEYISAIEKTLGRDIPLHISRFFPKFRMTDREATDVPLIYHLADVAREYLKYVYTGNC